MVPARILVIITCLVLVVAIAPAISAETVDHYQAAIERFIVPYSHGIVTMTVTVGTNEPAGYSLEMWTKGKDVTSSVIVDASAAFMIGLAFLEEGDQVTAWWPSIETEKTFDSSQTEEQVGFGMGRLDRVIWQSENYEAKLVKETESSYQYRVTLRDGAWADFSYGIIDVNKADGTVVRADFFDANDEMIETDKIAGYEEFTMPIGERILYPMSFICDDIANDKRTTMEYTKIEFPESIDDSVFTVDFLKTQSAAALNQTY